MRAINSRVWLQNYQTHRNKDINTSLHYKCMVYSDPHSAMCHYIFFPALKMHKDLIIIKVLILWPQKSLIFYMEIIRRCDKGYADCRALCHHKNMPLLQTGNWQFRAVKCQCQTLIKDQFFYSESQIEHYPLTFVLPLQTVAHKHIEHWKSRATFTVIWKGWIIYQQTKRLKGVSAQNVGA